MPASPEQSGAVQPTPGGFIRLRGKIKEGFIRWKNAVKNAGTWKRNNPLPHSQASGDYNDHQAVSKYYTAGGLQNQDWRVYKWVK
jgi:hypothetical protein